MRRISVIVVIALLFAGFVSASSNETPTPVASENAGKTKSLVFAISPDASDQIKNAALEFCTRAELLSGGSLDIELRDSYQPGAAFSTGEADFIFADGSTNEYLALLGSPMLYRNHYHFTMTVNSRTVLGQIESVLREAMGAVPLGAYYGGSRYILSSAPLDNIKSAPDGADAGLALVIPGSHLTGIIEAYGFSVSAVSDLNTRYEVAYDLISQITEFTAEELSQENWRGSGLYCYQLMNNVRVRWLLVSAETLDSLDKSQRAAIEEANAYLYPLIDEHYLLRESFARSRLREMEVTFQSTPEALRASALKSLKNSYSKDILATYLLEWIESSYPA